MGCGRIDGEEGGVSVQGQNLKTGELETTERARLKVLDRGFRCFSDENLKLITERCWNQEA